MKKLEDYIVSIPDFPEEGIIFRDVTTVIQDPEGLKLAIDTMSGFLDGVDFDVVVGPEARGLFSVCLLPINWEKVLLLSAKRANYRERPFPRNTILNMERRRWRSTPTPLNPDKKWL